MHVCITLCYYNTFHFLLFSKKWGEGQINPTHIIFMAYGCQVDVLMRGLSDSLFVMKEENHCHENSRTQKITLKNQGNTERT